MSKRTKLKLRNIRMYLAKYIFNGRYIVRNILAATIIMTLVALISGVVLVIDDAKKDKADAQMVAKQQKEQSVSIYAYEISSVDADSISTLKADLEVKTETAVEANETQMVAESTGEFDTKCVAKTDSVNVRKEADVESDIVGIMNNGAVADIVATDGDWLQIASGDITGYVKKEYVLTGKEAEKYAKKYYVSTGTVNVDGVYVRDNTSKEAEIVDTAYVGTTYDVDIELTTSEWVCVNLEDGNKGYVYAEFITVTEGYPTAVIADAEDEESDETSEDDTETTDSEEESATEESEEEEAEEEPTTEQPQEEPEEEEPTTEEPKAEEPTTEEPKPENDNQVTMETTNRGAIALSDADINLMASIMTLECGGEPYEGQLAVANVILNRLQSGYYGSTISDVVYAPYQFSVTSSPMLDYYIQNGAQASCIQAAREAASGVNNIGSFTCFRPTWNIDTSTLGAYTIIGNHVFY